MDVSNDGSESVDQFLARIASVKGSRDNANEERTRKMEEEFLKSRKERQARRLERARSLSPSKTGPSDLRSTPQSAAVNKDTVLNPPVDFSPRSSTLSRSNAVSTRASPTLEAKPEPLQLGLTPSDYQESHVPPNTAAGLSRSGTLSWQQRPARDGGLSRPRPLSSVESVRPLSRPEENRIEDKPEPSRQEIAAALGKKDPSWFRQTQERGLGSAAFRRNQVEDINTVELPERSHILPGMSQGASEAVSNTANGPSESTAPSRQAQSVLPLDNRLDRSPSPRIPSLVDTAKPDLSSHRTMPSDSSSEIVSTVGALPGNGLTARSPSPTKGLGGFVESAMMKRSDSISKRWSVQASSGLKRGDSVAGIRPLSGVRSVHASSLSRDTTRDTSSSPTASLANESRNSDTRTKSRSATPESKLDASNTGKTIQDPTTSTVARPPSSGEDQLEQSPSKTFDSRRWSPTKSSWLESALLSKTEPPKPPPVKEIVPAWKATLQRNKSIRESSRDKTDSADDTLRGDGRRETDKTALASAAVRTPGSDLGQIGSVQQRQQMSHEEEDVGKPATAIHEPGKESPTKDVPIDNNLMTHTKSRELSMPVPDGFSTQAETDEKIGGKPPPVLKPKPQTPPQTDFRSSLRSRVAPPVNDSEVVPEFKSVFGKLKRAQTQSYVAPDFLKSNILSGKAALNVTGGPQKAERVDEFKESILQKKETMKANATSKRETSPLEVKTPKPEPVLPEALARRKTLHKASPSVTKLQSSFHPRQDVEEQAKPSVKVKPTNVPPKTAGLSTPEGPAAIPLGKPRPDSKVDPESVQPKSSAAQPTLRLKSPSPQEQTPVSGPPTAKQQREAAEPIEKVASVSTKSELPTGSKLASRLNPNLAALLSRGSAPRPLHGDHSSPDSQADAMMKKPTTISVDQDHADGAELTHMTKGRARGPKRRAPKSPTPATESTTDLTASRSSSQASIVTIAKAVAQPITAVSPVKTVVVSSPPTSGPLAARSVPLTTSARVRDESVNKAVPNADAKLRPKPAVASKSPDLKRVPSASSSLQMDGSSAAPSNSTEFQIAADVDTSPVQNKAITPRELPRIPQAVPGASPLTPSKSRVNVARPTPGPAQPPAKPQSPKPNTGLNSSTTTTPTKVPASTGNAKPLHVRPIKPSASRQPPNQSTTEAGVHSTLSEYFAGTPPTDFKQDIDAVDLLSKTRAATEKIKTISTTVWEINGDGKKAAMPPQQEHILFEDAMYLVLHSFEVGTSGRSSEAYLWCGDNVANAAIEDAQLFARKDARDHNAKLEVLKQGKESARLFQALGGILIVRRSKSSSLYMLRGRRHLGHIAFDEIDLDASNLCSGFAYLISAKFGKLYLWKGVGSGADEVGCARLIGMDLGLTGEIEEVADGQEPAAFWDSFLNRSRNEAWSKDWQQRAEHNCYPSVLYRVNYDQPKAAGGFWGLRAASPPKTNHKIVADMIHPFCDRDLEPTDIYVLDAYRSIYVIIPPHATTKAAEFTAALYFAQDLAMLAPSVQDRSLLPACFVAFGDPPPDVQMCFRKWTVGRLPPARKPSACIKLEHVMEAWNL